MAKITAAQYNELMNLLKAEFARRSGKDINGNSLGYPGLVGVLRTVWKPSEFVSTVTDGSAMLELQGSSLINKLNEITDVYINNKYLHKARVGGNIQDIFDYASIKNRIIALSKESYTGSTSSCRSRWSPYQ